MANDDGNDNPAAATLPPDLAELGRKLAEVSSADIAAIAIGALIGGAVAAALLPRRAPKKRSALAPVAPAQRVRVVRTPGRPVRVYVSPRASRPAVPVVQAPPGTKLPDPKDWN